MSKERTIWNAEEIEIVKRLKEEGLNYGEIAKRVGRSEKGVKVKLIKMRTGVQNALRQQKSWTPEETEQLRRLRDVERKSFTEIAKIMGRPSGTVASKHMYLRTNVKGIRVESNTLFTIPDETRQEWRRRQTIGYRDLTAAFCGDPPIGYSALCKRGQQ